MRLILGMICLSVLMTLNGQAQNSANQGATKHKVQAEYLGTFQPKHIDSELYPTLDKVRENNKSEDEAKLIEYKKQWSKLKRQASLNNEPTQQSNKTAQGTIDPIKISGFEAIGNQGTPSDNTIAISKGGQIMVAVNSRYRVYNSSGNTLGNATDLEDLFDAVTPTNNLCDPLIHYDPDYDRFIVMSQTCDASPAQSSILLAFSTSNDATGTFHYYRIETNLTKWDASYPVDVWFDYPKMAVSQNDVFISGNMFTASLQFRESAMFQLDKTKCFAGSTLNSSDAAVFNAFTTGPFTLVPVTYARDGNYGNKMYVVSSRAQGTFIPLFEINGPVQTSTLSQPSYLTVPQIVNPADGVQPGTSIDLNTGDARGMNAILINNVIHFVFHSGGPNGYVAINYNRLYKSNGVWKADNKLISFPNVDCAFPAVASSGWDDQDQSVIITYNYSSLTDYPGIRCFMIDNFWNVSNPIELYSGTDFVTLLASGGRTRWGDYSGIARDHSAAVPTVWTFGMAGNNQNRWDNYVAQVSAQTWSVDVNDAAKNTQAKPIVFPNPVRDFWSIKLNFNEGGPLSINLLDMQGRKTKSLINKEVSNGEHAFSFNKGSLAVGTYFVQVKLNNKIVSNEKIVVAK